MVFLLLAPGCREGRPARIRMLAGRGRSDGPAARPTGHLADASPPAGSAGLSPSHALPRRRQRMGRIVVTEYISVDGVVEAPSGTEDFERVGWTDGFARGPEGDRFKVEETMAADAMLLGRVTYKAFAAVWPHVQGEFADRFNTMPKYVV